MKKYLLIIFLWFGQLLYGQDSGSITKIIFTYAKGHNSWDESGVYARSEHLEYIKLSNELFKLNKYFKIKYSVDKPIKKYSEDTIIFNCTNNSFIESDKMNNIISQLYIAKDNYEYAFIRPRLKSPNKKYIYNVARKSDELWKLRGKDAYRPDTKQVIKEIKAFNNLDSFIYITKPDTQGFLVVSDVWNVFTVELITTKDTTICRSQFFVPLGQPFWRYHKGQNDYKLFVNLEVNTTIQNILPRKSLMFDILDINGIQADYIKWYLNKYF
jgi:hypothetical protein